jgi:NADPH2:quinone reductase
MVPLTARVARVHSPGGPEKIVIDEVELSPLGPNDVRIAVAVAGVTYPDLLQRSGALPVPSLPYALGFEVAGTVEAAGADVSELAPGTRVVAELPRGGGYATRVVVPASAVTPIPAAIGFAEAVALFVSGRTALLMLRHARLAAGETVLVPSALGGVGSMAVRLAAAMGARPIAGVGSDGKLARARALGAVAAVNLARTGWADEIHAATGGRGADVVLQSTGDVGRESLRALAPLGRLVLFGADNVVHPEPLAADQVRALIAQGQSFGGFALMRTAPDVRSQAFTELADRVASGELPLELARYSFDDVCRAHADMSARVTIGKVVLEVT